MSLILDALRKLEREKDAREPGVLVVGSVPWGERSQASRLLLIAGACAVLALAVGVGWLLRPVRQVPVPAQPAAAPTTQPARAAPTPPPAIPSLPAVSLQPAEPPPPPIRLSRPPAERPPSSITTPSAARGAAATPAAASEPAGAAEPDTARPAPVAAAPPTVGLSSLPAATAAEPPPPPAGAPGNLRLTAISQRDGRPVALINDRLVFEGDSFDGVKVLRIGDAEVEVEMRGERKTLRF